MIWTNARWNVRELKDHPDNPRSLSQKGLDDLRKSIERCGYVEPIAINLDGTILSGHVRTKILRQLGLTEIDVRLPERMLTPEEQREVLVRLNKNVAGTFDFDVLANTYEIKDLVEWGFEPYEVGISLEDIAELPGLPAIGKKVGERISSIIYFDTPEDKADFLKQAPPVSFVNGNAMVTAYHYPPLGPQDLAAYEWK